LFVGFRADAGLDVRRLPWTLFLMWLFTVQLLMRCKAASPCYAGIYVKYGTIW